MPSERPIVVCEEVVKTYRTPASEVRALKGVSFAFPEAAVSAVVGPSGSGKSSLLRLVAGMDRPTAGSVDVAGVAVQRASASALRRLRRGSVGYLFQRPSDNFLPYLTVREHLRLAARVPSRAAADALELLVALGIAERVDHLPAQLSGGEQQRAAIAQVLIGGARIVVADEPTAELDTASARGVVEAIHDLARTGVTFVVATHDPAVIRGADATLELDHGERRGRRPVKAGALERDPPPTSPVEPIADGRDGLRWRPPPVEPSRSEPPLPALVVRGLSKTYRRGDEEVHALRDVELSLATGALTGLVGRSGSGKTTLLNVISGWEHPDLGTVGWDGSPDGEPDWSEIAVVPQKLGLLEELTIRENVEYPARLEGRAAELALAVDELLGDLGLDALRDRYPRETSLGEQQRAAVARAIVVRPRVLLADEPTGHQDLGFAERVFAALERVAGLGTACLVATHDEHVVRFLDVVHHISDGVLSER